MLPVPQGVLDQQVNLVPLELPVQLESVELEGLVRQVTQVPPAKLVPLAPLELRE